MQEFSVCPGCGRLVSTRYPFMHRAGRSVVVFCLASCFVRWHREQRWRQHETAMRSEAARPQAAASARGFDERWPVRPPPAERTPAQAANS
jgi:hypothetical protein